MREPDEILSLLRLYFRDVEVRGRDWDGMGVDFSMRIDGPARRWRTVRVISSWEAGWDHCSVSFKPLDSEMKSKWRRLPGYREMKTIKRVYFRSDEWALEYHPPDAEYVSANDGVLHLWRPHDQTIPTPPGYMV